MAGHGGKREGAGKPKGRVANHTIEVAEARKRLVAAYLKEQEPIDKALLEKAKTGDIPAIKELYDRVFGKSPQALDVEVSEKLKIADDQFQQIIRTAAERGNR